MAQGRTVEPLRNNHLRKKGFGVIKWIQQHTLRSQEKWLQQHMAKLQGVNLLEQTFPSPTFYCTAYQPPALDLLLVCCPDDYLGPVTYHVSALGLFSDYHLALSLTLDCHPPTSIAYTQRNTW